MHFDCPGCQQRLEIENDRVGEYLPCPACDRMIRVPRAPIVLHKGASGRRSDGMSSVGGSGGIRLVPIPLSARNLRPGSLAARVAALKAQLYAEEPKLL